MATKPVVDGFDKQLAGRVRFVRIDVNSDKGRKIAAKAGVALVPTLIGYDGAGEERWRMQRVPNRPELWRRLIAL